MYMPKKTYKKKIKTRKTFRKNKRNTSLKKKKRNLYKKKTKRGGATAPLAPAAAAAAAAAGLTPGQAAADIAATKKKLPKSDSRIISYSPGTVIHPDTLQLIKMNLVKCFPEYFRDPSTGKPNRFCDDQFKGKSNYWYLLVNNSNQLLSFCLVVHPDIKYSVKAPNFLPMIYNVCSATSKKGVCKKLIEKVVNIYRKDSKYKWLSLLIDLKSGIEKEPVNLAAVICYYKNGFKFVDNSVKGPLGPLLDAYETPPLILMDESKLFNRAYSNQYIKTFFKNPKISIYTTGNRYQALMRCSLHHASGTDKDKTCEKTSLCQFGIGSCWYMSIIILLYKNVQLVNLLINNELPIYRTQLQRYFRNALFSDSMCLTYDRRLSLLGYKKRTGFLCGLLSITGSIPSKILSNKNINNYDVKSGYASGGGGIPVNSKFYSLLNSYNDCASIPNNFDTCLVDGGIPEPLLFNLFIKFNIKVNIFGFNFPNDYEYYMKCCSIPASTLGGEDVFGTQKYPPTFEVELIDLNGLKQIKRIYKNKLYEFVNIEGTKKGNFHLSYNEGDPRKYRFGRPEWKTKLETNYNILNLSLCREGTDPLTGTPRGRYLDSIFFKIMEFYKYFKDNDLGCNIYTGLVNCNKKNGLDFSRHTFVFTVCHDDDTILLCNTWTGSGFSTTKEHNVTSVIPLCHNNIKDAFPGYVNPEKDWFVDSILFILTPNNYTDIPTAPLAPLAPPAPPKSTDYLISPILTIIPKQWENWKGLLEAFKSVTKQKWLWSHDNYINIKNETIWHEFNEEIQREINEKYIQYFILGVPTFTITFLDSKKKLQKNIIDFSKMIQINPSSGNIHAICRKGWVWCDSPKHIGGGINDDSVCTWKDFDNLSLHQLELVSSKLVRDIILGRELTPYDGKFKLNNGIEILLDGNLMVQQRTEGSTFRKIKRI